MRRSLVAGNWKMNGTLASAEALARGVAAGLPASAQVDVLLCPPFPHLERVRAAVHGSKVAVGAQDVAEFAEGACTGGVSSGMLLDLGCTEVIVGHSERRRLFGEDDARIGRKLRHALEAGLGVVLCLGETAAERAAGSTLAVVHRQLAAALDGVDRALLGRLALAYEPVWAIGTGQSATPADAQVVHAALRAQVEAGAGAAAADMRILYGGSVNAANAAALFAAADVDGALVGGASLDVTEFLTICRHAVSGEESTESWS